MTDPDAVSKAFVQHYYNLFDTNRAALGPLYQDNSMLTFEGVQTLGTTAIVQKLLSLPFQKIKHNIQTTDCQPSMSNGLIVFVTGNIQTEGEVHVLKFSQVFHLAPLNNSFIVTNDMFRLV